MWYFCFIFCFVISRWPCRTMLVVMVTMHRYTKGNFRCKKVEGSLQYAWSSKDIHTLGHMLLSSAQCRFIGFFQVVDWITDLILAAYQCIYITCGGICQWPDAPRICLIYADVKALLTFSCVTLCKLWAQLWTVRWLCGCYKVELIFPYGQPYGRYMSFADCSSSFLLFKHIINNY